jgi:hypothetical protein
VVVHGFSLQVQYHAVLLVKHLLARIIIFLLRIVHAHLLDLVGPILGLLMPLLPHGLPEDNFHALEPFMMGHELLGKLIPGFIPLSVSAKAPQLIKARAVS